MLAHRGAHRRAGGAAEPGVRLGELTVRSPSVAPRLLEAFDESTGLRPGRRQWLRLVTGLLVDQRSERLSVPFLFRAVHAPAEDELDELRIDTGYQQVHQLLPHLSGATVIQQHVSELVQEMLDACSFAATAAECEVETELRNSYSGYRFKRDEDVVRLAARALERCGYEPSYALSGGAADANVFNDRGRRCVNLANGMTDIHTPNERIALADLDAMVEVTLALVEEARA